MQNKKTILFDFDGTIADTFDLMVEVYNKEIAPRYKMKQVSREEAIRLRSVTPKKEFLEEYNVSSRKLPLMVLRARREMSKRMDEVRPQKGMVELIRSIKGCKLGILSSNSKKNIKFFLEKYGLSQYFDFIVTSRHVLGKHRAMKKFKGSVYVGDEVRDIRAAKKAGVVSIAVTWGYNKREALERENPEHMIDSPAQLLEIV